MSYLSVPRIHFGGLFFANPNTINNFTSNYAAFVELKDAVGNYTERYPGGGRNWNPTGVSQLWLEDCRVLSAVNEQGKALYDADDDSIIGAAVESASPKTPQSDGSGGYRDLAKLVDLDPDQQGRSAVFGLRMYLKLPNGGGLAAKWDVPNLRDLFERGDGGYEGYMQIRAGCWKSRLREVVWHDSTSPLLEVLRRISSDALDLKLTVDLYQRDRAMDLSDAGKGNRFGFGRVMGTIGPAEDGEPVQVVPGRLLLDTERLRERNITLFLPPLKADFDEKATQEMQVRRQASDAPAWNTAPFVIHRIDTKIVLTIDLGCSIPSADKGKMALNEPLVVGFQSGRALANGRISISDTDYVKVEQALERKDAYWLRNSGVYDIELANDEAQLARNIPFALWVGTKAKLMENPDGLHLAVEPPVLRMEPNSENSEARLIAYQFGVPMRSLPANFRIEPQVVQWVDVGTSYEQQNISTNVIGVQVAAKPATPGAFPITVTSRGPVPLVPIREPLDSQVYVGVITPNRTDHTFPLTILFWQNHKVVANPTWENGIVRVLGAYARLYPGMKGRLDIGNEVTVRGFARAVLELMSRPFDDPEYMPVVRDLSPSIVRMVIKWLRAIAGGPVV